MQITLKRDSDLTNYDSGGGMRDVSAVITIDENLSPRMQRHTALYEALGCCLGYMIPHEQLENLADILLDVFDQLEPI